VLFICTTPQFRTGNPLLPPPKLVLLGHGTLALHVLTGLLNSACNIVGVYPWADHPKGHDFLEDPEEKALLKTIKQAGLTRLTGVGLCKGQAFQHALTTLHPDGVLVASWGEIIPAPVLSLSTFINCHPSLLPAYRGANPYAAAILNGETTTGVSFHRMTPSVDAGPVLLQAPVPIGPQDTGNDLRQRCALMAQTLIPSLITQWGQWPEIPQPTTMPTHAAPTLATAALNWEQPAQALYNQVRGLQPWILAYSYWNDQHLLQVEEACVGSGQGVPGVIAHVSEGLPWVGTGDGLLGLKRYRLYWQGICVPGWWAKKLMTPGQHFAF
jgi:methionyl-tRNA formyltransferase